MPINATSLIILKPGWQIVTENNNYTVKYKYVNYYPENIAINKLNSVIHGGISSLELDETFYFDGGVTLIGFQEDNVINTVEIYSCVELNDSIQVY